MNDYCNGIAYATGYFVQENDKKYLVVRNLDKWYPEQIAKISKNKVYHQKIKDIKTQYIIKARDISEVSPLNLIQDKSSFCRAYIEVHGILDMSTALSRNGMKFKKPRLRIYGTEEQIQQAINNVAETMKPSSENIVYWAC